jgi:ribosomal protein S26
MKSTHLENSVVYSVLVLKYVLHVYITKQMTVSCSVHYAILNSRPVSH